VFLPDQTFGTLRCLPGHVERGMLVRHAGRVCVVSGFDPMSVTDPCAYLVDRETREQHAVVLADLLGRHFPAPLAA
jgi:hypothetical protein